ncbi:MAG: hypothetical protein EXQ52_17975 [Bryobacterales bacterium]|nr:hypothetical protein [Bryobacterales bacterium]
MHVAERQHCPDRQSARRSLGVRKRSANGVTAASSAFAGCRWKRLLLDYMTNHGVNGNERSGGGVEPSSLRPYLLASIRT